MRQVRSPAARASLSGNRRRLQLVGKRGRREAATRLMLPWSVRPDKPKAKTGPAVSTAARERKEREAAETDQLIDTILAACRSGDEARRRDDERQESNRRQAHDEREDRQVRMRRHCDEPPRREGADTSARANEHAP